MASDNKFITKTSKHKLGITIKRYNKKVKLFLVLVLSQAYTKEKILEKKGIHQ